MFFVYYFIIYCIIKEVTEGIHEVSEDLKFKCVSFVAALNKWRKKSE